MSDWDDYVELPNPLDSPPTTRCGRCERISWEHNVGDEDRMTQPDGYPCGGRFEAY